MEAVMDTNIDVRAYCILHKMHKMRKLHIGCVNAQYRRKIVLISPMRNICARFPQCARLYLFLQCAI